MNPQTCSCFRAALPKLQLSRKLLLNRQNDGWPFAILSLPFFAVFRLCAVCVLLWTSFLFPKAVGAEAYMPETDPLVLRKLEQWQDLKFGLLMHWGPYSQWGIVESWSICSEDEPWCRRHTPDYEAYKKQYVALKNTFNPVRFDPEKWARAAKAAGMRYVVFTTKHHDGFCMFDTRTTDYKITDSACPFSVNTRSNVTREIFRAFRQEGLWTGAYFSKPDWHSEFYWWPNFATPDRNVNYRISRYPDRWHDFVQFTHTQINELMSDYGPVDILWLDGGWVAKGSLDQDIHIDELAASARAKQPGLIVVDRAVPGMHQDYLTPENQVPQEALPYPWESCMIAGGGWAWTPDRKYLSPRKTIQMLVDIVAKGGNLLLNIGPGPDGDWDPEAYELLAQVGQWIKLNGEAIYGTRAVKPYKAGKLAFTRAKDGTEYAMYLAAENETTLPEKILIPDRAFNTGTKFSLLNGNTFLRFEISDEGPVLSIPQEVASKPYCEHAWVIRMQKGE
jgi:alpha-L-fucosidase